MVYVIALTVILGAIDLYYYLSKDLNQFKKYDTPHLKLLPLLGNMAPSALRKMSLPELVKKVYDVDLKARYVGMYDFIISVIMWRDINPINTIALKRYDMFMDHQSFITEQQEQLLGSR